MKAVRVTKLLPTKKTIRTLGFTSISVSFDSEFGKKAWLSKEGGKSF